MTLKKRATTEAEIALRGALSFVNEEADQRIDGTTLSALLIGTTGGDAQWKYQMRRLLSSEDATILQDLVYGRVCSFTDLARQASLWSIEPNLLTTWIDKMAELERRERVA